MNDLYRYMNWLATTPPDAFDYKMVAILCMEQLQKVKDQFTYRDIALTAEQQKSLYADPTS